MQQERQCLAMMERQIAQLSRLIDELLDVSRITSGKLELHQERCRRGVDRRRRAGDRRDR